MDLNINNLNVLSNLVDLLSLPFDRNIITANKTRMALDFERLKTRALIHADQIDQWIESTLKLDDDRIELLYNQIDRFEHMYPENEYKTLAESLRRKLKHSTRKAYLVAIVKLLAEKAYKSKKLNFKTETGVDDQQFINIFMTHSTQQNKLIVEYVANSPQDSRTLEFDFPYLESNPNIPHLAKLEDIIQKIITVLKINVDYKSLELI